MRCALLLLLLMLLGAPAAAQTAGGDTRLQVIPYDAGQVVPLRIALGFQTTIVFGTDERIENVAIGDSDAWQVAPDGRGAHLFIKPLRASGSTNLTVITDARIYSFELSAASTPAPDTPFTVRFLYPEAPSSAPGTSQPSVDGRYRLSGARSLRPSAISDDGSSTMIGWRPHQTLPAVFALDPRGHEMLLDGHVRNGLYVIDTVHQTLIFRLDGETARATRLRPTRARP